MNTIKIFILTLVLLFSATSCVDILDDNINKDKPSQILASDGLPVVVFYAQQTVYDHAEYNLYLSQCLTTGNKSQVGSYSYKSEWEFLTMNRHPQWRRHFYDLGVNIKNMIANSKTIGSPNYELIGRTVQLLSTQLTTDAFGDMPRTQVYLSNNPAYDTQPSIYEWMFKEADELIAMYEKDEIANNPKNLIIDKKQDRIYAGDLKKWKGLVYAIKARLLLRNIPNVDRTPAMCQKVIAAADAAINQWRSGDLLYGAWFGNEPRYNFDGGTNEQNCVWSMSQPIINAWESRRNELEKAVPSKFFMIDCLGLLNPEKELQCGLYVSRQGFANDPRAALLMQARTGPASSTSTAKSIKLRYLDNNIGMGTSYKGANYPDLFFGAYGGSREGKGYNPIFTMEELYFIKAEALYWMGDKTGACILAKEATTNNIQRHLDWFLTEYPNTILYDPVKDNKYPGGADDKGIVFERKEYWDGQVDAFLNNNALKTDKGVVLIPQVTTRGNKTWFFEQNTFSLSDLMTQKYISMYMQPEQWTDLRRYHYSNKRNNYGIGDAQEIVYTNLRRPYNLYASYWIDGLTDQQKENTWLQRINYDPQTEDVYNIAELQRLGAYKNHKWLQKPMIWAEDYGKRSSLTAE